ncbi:hypothetical protein CAEBREN_05398 [Caenorhabditis brenneri]|uniref:BTB domain-containing protein n=1 Tax=Caenorhabditis brenneri TaxID=135651 RepID=G0MNY2_CAEBE|nr:hypothetical protein CAEBREN_05398 [Caenorhabditis brenneri]
MTKEEDTNKWTFGGQMDTDTVEVWMTENGGKKSFLVDKNRLFVMGMKSYPEIIDLMEMSESSAKVFYELLTGSRHYSAQVSMNQAAEIIHVATELKLTHLLKIMEKDLIKQTSTSMEQAVDSLSVAVKFGLKDAVEKLVDEIVFGFLDEQLLMYCKSSKALEMVMNRKSELVAQENAQMVTVAPHLDNHNLGHIEQSRRLPDYQAHQRNQVALPNAPQNAQMHRVILTAAKEKFRTLLNRPINTFKNGIAWVSAKNLRRRPQRRDDDFDELLDFDHLRMLNQ